MDLKNFYPNGVFETILVGDAPSVDTVAVENTFDKELDALVPYDEYLGRRPSMLNFLQDERVNPLVAERLGEVLRPVNTVATNNMSDEERISLLGSRHNTTYTDMDKLQEHYARVIDSDAQSSGADDGSGAGDSGDSGDDNGASD